MLNFLILVFLLTLTGSKVTSSKKVRSSGFYVDNGNDQTVLHELTTQKEKTALEHEILKLLGLPDRPNGVIGKVPLTKRSAPNFLLNVYESSLMSDDEKWKRPGSVNRSDFNLSGDEMKTINRSDSIVTFSAQQSHQGAGGKPDRVKRIWFDIDAAPKDERMTSAELRLYRGPEAKNRKNRGAFTIILYRVSRIAEEERTFHFVDSINTTSGQVGWLTLNVTECLAYWMRNPGDNRGLYMSARPIDLSDHETRPEDIGIVGFKGDAEKQPFMIGFFESTGRQLRFYEEPLNPDYDEVETIQKSKRDTSNDIRDLLKDYYDGKPLAGSTKPCRLNTLYVSFKDLQWQDWIIAPEGYDAYFCGGECRFPMTGRMNATNHAIIQTLVHLVRPSKVPKPCCTPTQLSTISLLYFHDDNNVVLRKYKNMAVRGCGCH